MAGAISMNKGSSLGRNRSMTTRMTPSTCQRRPSLLKGPCSKFHDINNNNSSSHFLIRLTIPSNTHFVMCDWPGQIHTLTLKW
eukprot:8848067-Pyramimonas_sp.AAC.1